MKSKVIIPNLDDKKFISSDAFWRSVHISFARSIKAFSVHKQNKAYNLVNWTKTAYNLCSISSIDLPDFSSLEMVHSFSFNFETTSL